MRVRWQASPCILLLLPALASSLAYPQLLDDTRVQGAVSHEAVPKKDYTAIPDPADLKLVPTSRPLGTKDAPVDGLDGKPHAGPWVDNTKDANKKPSLDIDEVADVKKAVPTSLSKLQETASIPEKNDGVMDDGNRVAPKKGTTGTEGGVSEKNKLEKATEMITGEKVEKKPDSPKEAPPLPHSEQKEIQKGTDGLAAADKDKSSTSFQAEKPKGAVGLEKPTDLPNTPHEAPKPAAKEPSALSDSLIAGGASALLSTMPYTEGQRKVAPGTTEEPEGLIQPLHSLILSFTMILVSEIGDKTFLVAALMAMRHDRLVVFSAAFSALVVMTILSAVLGHALPTLLPKRFTAFAAALLFLVFGAKMLREGIAMSKDSGVGEEMKEVEAELEEKEHQARKSARRRSSISPYLLESGRGRTSGSRGSNNLPAPPHSPPSSDNSRSPSPSGSKRSVSNAFAGLNNLFSLLLSPAWVQTFIMTFLGEWGDRSQIATIAMAAGQDYWWVTGGAISGHAICTGIAVIGGRALAGRVSLRVVTLGGAGAFLVFGVIYLLEAIYSD